MPPHGLAPLSGSEETRTVHPGGLQDRLGNVREGSILLPVFERRHSLTAIPERVDGRLGIALCQTAVLVFCDEGLSLLPAGAIDPDHNILSSSLAERPRDRDARSKSTRERF